MPKRLFFIIAFLVIQMSFAFSQVQTTSELSKKLLNYTRNRPEEKVYLHFDKDYYVAGETLWFKSYTTLGGGHSPSLQGGLLYVDFYNKADKFIKQIKISSKNGLGSGHFDIPDNLAGNELRVRAYTNWMRNFNKDFIFQKSLRLINNEPTQINPIEAYVNFYPEGGQMISGLVNRIAIKTNLALTEDYFLLLDNDGNELEEVEINENGYGQFPLKPKEGKRYFLSANGQKFEVPAPMYEGISLTVNSYSNPNNVRLTLRKKTTTGPNKVSLLVHVRGTVHYYTELDFSRAAAIANIPKGILPAGVNHLTIFDETGKPLAERLFYMDRVDPVKLMAKTTELTSTRKKVVVDLNLTGVQDKQVLASSLSLSATQRSNIYSDPDQENIKTYLLLNSDLRGQIKNPGYYFTDQSIERKIALDLVMMTHGWRRFTWDKILNQPLDSVKFEPENGLTIKGRMVAKGNRKPIKNGTLTYLNNQNNQLVMRNQITNESGEFELTDLLHTTEDKVLLKGVSSTKGLRRQSKQFIDFELDTALRIFKNNWLFENSDDIGKEAISQIIAETEERQLYDSLYNFDPDVRIVQGVTVEDNRLDDPTEVSPIYGRGTVTFEVPETPTAEAHRDIFSLMAGSIAGVSITPGLNRINTIVQIRGAVRIGDLERDPLPGEIGGVIPPKYVLNDMPSDIQTLAYIPVADIDRVEVFKGPDAAAHGLNTLGGVIAVYTKTKFGESKVGKPEEGLYSLKLPGLQAPREFFGPDYATSIPEHAKPDTRSLVHWQPFIETDDTGKASVTFWTTDNTGFIDINIQGLTYGGIPLVRKISVKIEEEQ